MWQQLYREGGIDAVSTAYQEDFKRVSEAVQLTVGHCGTVQQGVMMRHSRRPLSTCAAPRF